MVSFDYLINDAMGLHARPVGLVVKAVKPYKESEITIEHDGQTADAKSNTCAAVLMSMLRLQVTKLAVRAPTTIRPRTVIACMMRSSSPEAMKR